MPEPFEKRVQRVEKMNMDLLYAISDGSKTDMDAWGATDIYDFFMGLWSHQDAVERVLENIEKQKRK